MAANRQVDATRAASRTAEFERELLVPGGADLEDARDDHDQQRYDQGELDESLSTLVPHRVIEIEPVPK